MAYKPREWWIEDNDKCESNIAWRFTGSCITEESYYEVVHVIEAGPILEKIARLETALQKCRAQRDDYLFNLHEVAPNFFNYALAKEEDEEELESTLEGE